MSNPNFEVMSKKELQAYVLNHREDEAFHFYIDKLHAEENWIKMPPLKSVDDRENYPEFIEHLRKSAARQNKTD